MKKIVKKFLTITLCFTCIFAMATSAYAATGDTDKSSTKNEVLLEQLYVRGLTEENIKTLCRRGFSLEEQLSMGMDDINIVLCPVQQFTDNINSRVSTVTVYNVPDEYIGPETAIFLPNCGLVSGDFYEDNPGSLYTARINIFANYVFNGATCNKYYNLFGEYDPTYGYHKGVDLKAANGTSIFSAHAGSVSKRADYGAVIIYDGYASHAYLHMTNMTNNTSVNLGQKIGNQSNVSTQSIGNHLHYEVRRGNSTSLGGSGTTNYNEIPYSYMIQNANYFSRNRQFIA